MEDRNSELDHDTVEGDERLEPGAGARQVEHDGRSVAGAGA